MGEGHLIVSQFDDPIHPGPPSLPLHTDLSPESLLCPPLGHLLALDCPSESPN